MSDSVVRIQRFLRKCRADFQFFGEKLLKIQTKEGTLIPFKFNRVQRVLWMRLQEDLKEGRPIRWLILKGRQMGMSTFIAGFFFWLISMRTNRNAVVAAHKENSASELFRKQQLFFRELPQELKPMVKTFNRGHIEFANPDPLSEEKGLESQILVDVASNVDLGRSFALHLLHWSEFAMTLNAKETLAAARNAMPQVPGTALIIETTAKGPGVFQELWDDESNEYTKVFICWVAEDNYRDNTPIAFEDLHDTDHEQFGNEHTERKALLKELRFWYPEHEGDNEWYQTEVLHRLSWRRRTILNECGGDLKLFRQEYPTVPEDAFLGTGRSLFDNYKLSDIKKRLHDKPLDKRTYRFDFRESEFYSARYGPLVMYEPVKPEATYVIGADPAMGVKGGDPSAAVLLRCPEMVVSGTFNAIVPPSEFAVILYHWGKLANDALIGVEANEEGGYTVNSILGGKMEVDGIKYRYNRLYRRDIDERLLSRTTDKVGWKTNPVTKDIMINDLRSGIGEDAILLTDEEIVVQLMNYQEIVTVSGKKRLGVPTPGHDDLAMATMIAYQMATRAYHQAVRKNKNRVEEGSVEWYARRGDNQFSKFGVETRFGLT